MNIKAKFISKKNLINILIATFYIAYLTSCQQKEEPTEAELATVGGIATTETIQVKTAIAEEKVFEYFIETKGKVTAKKQVELIFETQGRIEKIHKQNGVYVKKGEVIAELDKTKLKLALEKAKLELQVKQGDYQLKVEEYAFYNGDTSSLNEQQRLNMLASSGLGIARLNYDEAKYQFENAVLKAPFSGRIANLFINEGSLTNNKVFCTLFTSNELSIQAEVLESDIPLLKIGQKATVRFIGNEQVYEAKLQQINPLVEENGQVRIVLILLKPSHIILGMNASVTLHIQNKKTIVVPKEALVIRSGRNVVFTYEEGKAKWNYVEVGKENGKEIEIVEGLGNNEQVIISNNLQLEHDTEVQTY